MNENQRKWLLDLQGKGVMFEYSNMTGAWVKDKEWAFTAAQKYYRIPAQPVPDIPDWRELCRDMQSKGVRFKMLWGSMWNEGIYDFENERDRYQILQQPIPKWREEMTEETPHREQQIQWHEDMLHHLRTGEPMREWAYRSHGGKWVTTAPVWGLDYEYRRKPRTVTYWHCLVEGCGTTGVVYLIESTADTLRKHVESLGYEVIGHVTETTVEITD